jgi:putative endonuclease
MQAPFEVNFYTYIIYSQTADRYYVGSCADIPQRLKRHNDGATPSTKPYRPWILVYSECFPEKTGAIKRELQIKKMKSRRYIESLIPL